jgi:hypothetical protein
MNSPPIACEGRPANVAGAAVGKREFVRSAVLRVAPGTDVDLLTTVLRAIRASAA